MAQITHLSYSQFAGIYGDLGVTEWVKYNWLADYWKELTPDGYERVQYLESTGTQYIDTGVKPKNTTVVETEYFNDVNANRNIFGASNGIIEANTAYAVNTQGTDQIEFKYGNMNNWQSTPATGVFNTRFKVKFGQEGIYINGTRLDYTMPTNTFQSNKNLYIFWRAEGNEAYRGIGKVYSFYISEGNSYVQYLIPMVRTSDNKPGMYDLINHQFLTNQGILDFLAGPPVGYTQVEYLQSDGNQWIDTGLYGDQLTSVSILAQRVLAEPATGYRLFGSRIGPRNAGVFISTTSIGSEEVYYADFGSNDPRGGTITTNKVLYTLDSTKYKVGEQTIGTYTTSGTFTTPTTMALFGAWATNTESYNPKPWKVYNCVISSGLAVQQHLIPTLDPSLRPCLYDLITRTPFYNQGTGEFTWG